MVTRALGMIQAAKRRVTGKSNKALTPCNRSGGAAELFFANAGRDRFRVP
jgi:hypothetical protein